MSRAPTFRRRGRDREHRETSAAIQATGRAGNTVGPTAHGARPPQIIDIGVWRQGRQPTSNLGIRVVNAVGTQRQRAAAGPHGVRASGQVLQPGESLASLGVFLQRGDEGVQIATDVQCHQRVGKHTPHRTRQTAVAEFGNPTPSGIVNRQCQAGLKHCAGFLGKGASGEVDQPEFSVCKTAAGLE